MRKREMMVKKGTKREREREREKAPEEQQTD